MSLGRSSVVNLAGAAVPLLVSLPAVGALARVLDAERFALVLLAWALVGFAGVLDMGLSRATVRQSALLRDQPSAAADALRSAVLSVSLLGAAAALLVLLLRAPLLDALSVSAEHRDDAAQGLLWAALSIPLLLPVLVMQGHWDGVEDFVESNLQRALSSSLVPLLTLAGAAWDRSFGAAMSGLLLARVLALALALGRRGMAARLAGARFDAARLRGLLRDGGWVSVSNLVSPDMNTLDRYLLGFARQAAAVGFYAAPSDAANKLLVVPVAITRGLFPALSREDCAVKRQELVWQAHRLVALTCVPLAAAGAWLAPVVLGLWLGPSFVEPSTPVLQILMAGFLLGAFAQVPFTEVQARGRADLSARLHLLELVPFLIGAWWLSREHGAIGTALAWTLRYAADLLLHALAARSIREDGPR